MWYESKGKPNIISLEESESGETTSKLIREITEELSVTIPNTVEYIGTFQHNRTEKKKE
jgi:hypothetical protein